MLMPCQVGYVAKPEASFGICVITYNAMCDYNAHNQTNVYKCADRDQLQVVTVTAAAAEKRSGKSICNMCFTTAQHKSLCA